MRLSFKKPAKCVKELHSTEQQHANTHQHQQCWLTSIHVSADRVVNIGETSCRFLPMHQIGWIRRGVKQSQQQGNTREATTFTVAFSMDRGQLDMLVQIVHAGRRLAGAALAHTRHVTSETAWATTTTILQLAATLDDVFDPSKEGQAWILLWDMASIHASADTLAHEGHFSSRRAVLHPAAQHVVLAALPSSAASRAPDAGDHDTGPLRQRRLVRRRGHEQGMAAPVFGRMGSSRSQKTRLG